MAQLRAFVAETPVFHIVGFVSTSVLPSQVGPAGCVSLDRALTCVLLTGSDRYHCNIQPKRVLLHMYLYPLPSLAMETNHTEVAYCSSKCMARTWSNGSNR